MAVNCFDIFAGAFFLSTPFEASGCQCDLSTLTVCKCAVLKVHFIYLLFILDDPN